GATNVNANPVPGDPKTFSFDYHPGGRDLTSVSVTSSGSAAYIVGGRVRGTLSGDVWKFESDKGWGFWSGNSEDHDPISGTIKVPSETNVLGAKYASMHVVDDFDNLWMY